MVGEFFRKCFALISQLVVKVEGDVAMIANLKHTVRESEEGFCLVFTFNYFCFCFCMSLKLETICLDKSLSSLPPRILWPMLT